MLNSKLTDLDSNLSGHVLRFGVEGMYSFSPAEQFNPWAGIGIGYETLTMSSGDNSASLKGLEFLMLQGGVDYKVAPNMSVGPFLSFHLGQYSSQSVTRTGVDASGDITDTAMHHWLQFGLKGTFDM